MDSQAYIQDNPHIAVSTARRIMDQHDCGEHWCTFAFTDHPEAVNAGNNTVDTDIFLGWLGY